MPKRASSIPSGNGGVRRAPLTKCFSGTGMAVARPGSASSFATMETLWRPNMAGSLPSVNCSPIGSSALPTAFIHSALASPLDACASARTAPLEDDLLVTKLADLLGADSALGEDLFRVLAPERRGPPHARRHPREPERGTHHRNLAELRVRGLLNDTALDRLRVAHHLVHGVHGPRGPV